MCWIIVQFIFRRHQKAGTEISIKIQIICNCIGQSETEWWTVKRSTACWLTSRIELIVHIVITKIEGCKKFFRYIQFVNQIESETSLFYDLVDKNGIQIDAWFAKIGINTVQIMINRKHVFSHRFWSIISSDSKMIFKDSFPAVQVVLCRSAVIDKRFVIIAIIGSFAIIV